MPQNSISINIAPGLHGSFLLTPQLFHSTFLCSIVLGEIDVILFLNCPLEELFFYDGFDSFSVQINPQSLSSSFFPLPVLHFSVFC